MNLEKYLISENATILEAIDKINKNGDRFILIINNKSQVVGLATDGDIRRTILNKVGLKEYITKAMNRDFFYLNTRGDKFEVFEENIHFVPIINQKTKQLEDILFLDGQSRQNKYHEIPALIMAGGFGKRLRPLTNDVPKQCWRLLEYLC